MSKRKNPERYFVYGLANPLKLSKEKYIGGPSLYEFEFFYIGYTGTNRRLGQHLSCSKSDGNEQKKKLIKEIENAGEEVIFVKILENVAEYIAIKKEIEQIAYYGRFDKGLGPLTNMTDGGEGGNGGHGRNIIDLTGQIFGRLTVIQLQGKNKIKRTWLCRCECGNEKITSGSNLKCKQTQSCGCLRKETTKKVKTIHGMSNDIEYKIWSAFKRLCYKSNTKDYKNYGGRGVRVCDRWLNSFENFYEDMGERPTNKHILGRKDVNGDYEPSNCKWATRTEQNRKKRNSKLLTINGNEKPLKDWSDISGTNYSTIQTRLNRGWSHEEAVYGKEK